MPACHDTASAVASVEAGGTSAFLSSGTWSLLGTELPAPIVTQRTRELNFTNEGGVGGTTRLLKNIGGLWLLQSCRRGWARDGQSYGYDELLSAASQQAPGFTSLFDPDYRGFLHPDDMASGDRATTAARPARPSRPARAASCGPSSRAWPSSIVACSSRSRKSPAPASTDIRIVGGGSRNRLLNQFTANATGRTVIAGPVEATALGNIAMQMVATGAVSSLREARAVIDRSFPVERFEPSEADRWDAHYKRFHEYVELTCV